MVHIREQGKNPQEDRNLSFNLFFNNTINKVC